MKVLLVSTYELGRQPVHLASPGAALAANGIEVIPLDLAVEEWDPSLLDDVGGVAFSVPMHTAMRLAISMAGTIRALRPELPIAFYGLYAGVGSERTLGGLADALFVGEYEPDLVSWARGLERHGRVIPEIKRHVGRSEFLTPDRSRLPTHDNYARLEWEGVARVAGAVEASHGCRHRCRHCPIPVVYDGRMRVVGSEKVLSDIDQLAGAGVEHVTFGDPDFLNAPRYSLDLLREAHAAHPDLTFDVTVKVEHVLAHESMWPEMASLGVLFVVSAFESTDDPTLEILDKNHTAADMARAVVALRSAGVHIRPTWLPFVPWTKPQHLVDLVGFLDRNRLWSATDPVQLAIKLLIPQGSLLETHPAVVPHLSSYAPQSLTWSWDFDHPETRRLHETLDAVAAEGSDCGAEAADTLAMMRDRIGEIAGTRFPAMPDQVSTPRLSESWFCCAEPTAAQAAAVGLTIGRVPLAST
ncbi:MAG: radical SAM protein [Actinomycetota bacterium]|nr:radical SAM protein [Actinomycetota bacterium]